MTEALLLAVLAFAAPDNFKVPADRGGGNGMRFSGSPRSKWDCSVCHTQALELALDVTAAPGSLFTGGYELGTRYELSLSLGEAPLAGAFSMELVSRRGELVGQLAAVPGLPSDALCDDGSNPVEIQGAGEAAQSVSCRKGLGAWKVGWTAPASDVGPVTLYVSAVAGDLDGTFRGDRTTMRVLGIRSPSSPPERAGCGGAGALVVPFMALGVVIARRRRATIALLALFLVLPVSARGADSEPPGVIATASLGVGVEGLALSGPAFATPLQLLMLFPQASASVTLYPARFIEGAAALDGLALQISYARGWAALPAWLGAAFANPADALFALGYEMRLGALTAAPRLAYRVRMSGVEENAIFDDVLYQGLGGELGLEVSFGSWVIALRPQVLRELDAGTLSARGYGAFLGGWSLGGNAAASLRFGDSGWGLSLEYGYAQIRSAFAGGGERSLGPMEREDAVHSAALRVAYGR